MADASTEGISTAPIESKQTPPTDNPDTTEHAYLLPTRGVKHFGDMALWEKSQAYYDIIGFINAISQAIQGRKNTDNVDISPMAQSILEVFEKLTKLLSDTPPIEQPQRFGNQAYRDWYNKLKLEALQYLQDGLPEKFHRAMPEIVVYFVESFGNSTRIDYGTGHELAFIMFMCCLFKIGVLDERDRMAAGLKIFNTYLLFVRKLQLTYRMEPAGSHGVWSLDDYQFVPFIWGSAQLAVNGPIRPPQFLEENVISEYKDKYMFIGCIDYINKVKTGLFAEHSPQLWNISAVESWIKINTGLMKMYQKEVLAKFPLVQHVLFGSLMQLAQVKPGSHLPTARLGMLPPSFKSSVSKPSVA